jgi:hypothetical protein
MTDEHRSPDQPVDDDAEKRALVKALETFQAAVNGLRGKDQAEFLQMMTTIGICAIRGNYGDEYCRGYLMGALEDLDKPAEALRPPRSH